MPLTLLNDAPFSNTFTGVSAMQCMGSTTYTPATHPNGVAGSMEITPDGWFKGTIRQTDPPTATGIRAEIVLPPEALGDEDWFTWDMLIRSDEWTNNSGRIVLGQMHNKDTINAAVNFAFWAIGGKLLFGIPLTEPPAEGISEDRMAIMDLPVDRITSFAVHARWQNNTTGFLEVFVDGVQVYKNWRRGTAYNADAPYFKLGIYDGPHTADFGTKSARFRNLKRYSGSDGYSAILGQPPRPPKRLVGTR